MKSFLAILTLAAATITLCEGIINGQPATIGQFPHQVSLSLTNPVCGGAILDENTVITAGHCCYYYETQLRVLAGVVSLDSNADTRQERHVRETIIHEDASHYSPYGSDICLVKLSQPLELDGITAAPVTLPTNDDGLEEGDFAVISGWGAQDPRGGDYPTILHWANIPIVDKDKCNVIYEYTVEDYELCAGGNGKDASYGDNGSPLLCGNPDDRIMCGLMSWVTSITLESL